jgi:hypothetical protein
MVRLITMNAGIFVGGDGKIYFARKIKARRFDELLFLNS